MARPMVRIYTEPGVFVDREMNDEEFAQYEKDQAEVALEKQAQAAAQAQKQAILDRLGLTEEELRIVLG